MTAIVVIIVIVFIDCYSNIIEVKEKIAISVDMIYFSKTIVGCPTIITLIFVNSICLTQIIRITVFLTETTMTPFDDFITNFLKETTTN